MAPDSTVYDLGAHALEITSNQTILIAAHPTGDEPIKELIELSSEEVYKLLLALQEAFR